MTESEPVIVDTIQSVNLTPEQIQNFWSRVEKSEGCWAWTGSRLPHGYGRLTIRNGLLRFHFLAHRLSKILSGTPVPRNLYVLHSCDNTSCVNPAHLSLGTQQDNVDQMKERGRERKASGEMHGSRTKPHRVRRGTSHGMSRLSEEKVQDICSRYAAGNILQKQLAQEYGVNQTTISRALLNQGWKHVP